MARKVNYEAKIPVLKAKIAKKEDELQKLKTELSNLEEQKDKDDYKELILYIKNNKLTPAAALEQIKTINE